MEKKREEICLGAKSMHGTKWTQWIIGANTFFKTPSFCKRFKN